MPVHITVIGTEEVQKMLQKANEKVLVETEKAMSEITSFMVDEVKESVMGRRAEPKSFDTGHFAGNIFGTSTALTGTIYTEVEYAQFLEYGTIKLDGRLHFRNSYSRNKEKITDWLGNAVNRAIKL